MKRILINLKDWLSLTENIEFASKIDGLNVTVYPSLPYLYIYKEKNIEVGAQDIGEFPSGPHTGSVSPEHLKDFKVSSIILNHKEQPINPMTLVAKIKNATSNNLEVILCIEDIDESLLTIKEIMHSIDTTKITIAYEPSEELDIEKIESDLFTIKRELSEYDCPYIYGGNISKDNILFIKELPVDGFLISKHALYVNELTQIIETAK